MSTRTRSTRRFKGLGLAMVGLVAAATLTGCGGDKTARLEQQNRVLTERNTALTSELDSYKTTEQILRQNLTARDQQLSQSQSTIAKLRSDLLSLNDKLSAFDNRLTNIPFSQLDPRTDQALRNFASKYPNIVSYDSDRGMLRFTSDLTFGSGSDQVNDNAKQSLATLAQVLSDPQVASSYVVRVVGHTDSEPISSGTARRHPTNLHLSVHRAISVRKELVGSSKLDPTRVEVAGWGEFRPAVANNPKGGTAANRRVEIFLVPDAGNGSNSSQTEFTDVPTEPSRNDDIMK